MHTDHNLFSLNLFKLSDLIYRHFHFRDLQNLENWIETMEPRVETNELGESLEETVALAEEHRKFSRAVALQGEKCKRLAEFEIVK